MTRQPQDVHVQLQDVHMQFGDHQVLRGLNLSVQRGQVAVVIGGSGTGKTTLLRIIIGLLQPTKGAVWIEGENIATMNERALQHVRAKCAMVFQYSALLDSLTVLENVGLPLREHEKLSERELRARVGEMLSSVGLSGTEDLLPDKLSGGMRKRVGLARALIREPSLVVYDEPASGLDPLTARRVDDLILSTRDRLGVTSIVISHSMSEAVRLADRLFVLDMGQVAAEGTVAALRKEKDGLAAQFFEASGLGETATS